MGGVRPSLCSIPSVRPVSIPPTPPRPPPPSRSPHAGSERLPGLEFGSRSTNKRRGPAQPREVVEGLQSGGVTPTTTEPNGSKWAGKGGVLGCPPHGWGLPGGLSGREPTGWDPAPGTQPAHSRRSAVGGRGFSAPPPRPPPVPAAPTPPRFVLPQFPPHTAAGPPHPPTPPHNSLSLWLWGGPAARGGGGGQRGWSYPCREGLSGGRLGAVPRRSRFGRRALRSVGTGVPQGGEGGGSAARERAARG